MKKLKIIQIIISFLLILLVLYTGCEFQTTRLSGEDGEGNSNIIWTTQLLGVSGTNTIANDITLDSNGNIYTTGYTNGNLDGEILTGGSDLFVVKYNTNGVKQWTRLLGHSGGGTGAKGITSDSNGNIYITGHTNGNLDGQIKTGDTDLFVIKYDTDGNKLWTRLLGVSGEWTYAYGIASDTEGNIYTTGNTEGNLDGQILTGYRDLFIVKYDTNGDKQWTRLLSVSESTTMAFGITLDLSGNIYITGHTNGNLDGETLTGIYDLFVVKYDSSGNKQWTRLLGVSGERTYAYGIASDTEGNIYTTGYTEGDLDDQIKTGDTDLFVIKYDTDGSKLWTRLIGVFGEYTFAYGITSDTDGNIYTTGYTSGNLDGETLTGNRDLFVVKYNTNGVKQWTRLLGVAEVVTCAKGIISELTGYIYITGYTEGHLDGQIKTGSKDLFIVKYGPSGVKQ